MNAVRARVGKMSGATEQKLLNTAELLKIYIDPEKFENLDPQMFSEEQISQIKQLSGLTFSYRWELQDALIKISSEWAYRPATIINKRYNKALAVQLSQIESVFTVRKKAKKRNLLYED